MNDQRRNCDTGRDAVDRQKPLHTKANPVRYSPDPSVRRVADTWERFPEALRARPRV